MLTVANGSNNQRKTNMNAVFLDLEGPIVTHRSIIVNSTDDSPYQGDRTFRWVQFVDHTSLALVLQLCNDFKAEIVLTSLLRSNQRIVSQLYMLCHELSEQMKIDNPFDSRVTEHMQSQREKEILHFVKENEVKKWVAIDDKGLDLKNFVRVDPREGITWDAYQRCKPFLFDEETMDEKLARPEAIYL